MEESFTIVDTAVIDRITAVMRDTFGNPSSTHQFGRKARRIVEEARKSIAKHFNVTASEVVFTAGGSEADNLILRNAVSNLGVTTIISTQIEHHAVLHTIKDLEKEFGVAVNWINTKSFFYICKTDSFWTVKFMCTCCKKINWRFFNIYIKMSNCLYSI